MVLGDSVEEVAGPGTGSLIAIRAPRDQGGSYERIGGFGGPNVG